MPGQQGKRPVIIPRPAIPLEKAAANSVAVIGSGIVPGNEHDIEDAARQVCIQGGFSCCEEVRYVSPTLVYIDFPYQDAAMDFLNATNGQLKVRARVFKLQNANDTGYARVMSSQEEAAAESQGPERPTDTLMVRQIGDLTEQAVKKAFQAVVPSMKGVRMMIDRKTNKSKGFCFVNFYTVGEAETAKNKMCATGSLIEGRKVAIGFAKPQTHEQMLESDMSFRNEQNIIEAQAKQALGGINGDMWSSYMQFCDDEKDREAAAKAVAISQAEAALAAKRAALEARAAAAAAAAAAPTEEPGSSTGSTAPAESAPAPPPANPAPPPANPAQPTSASKSGMAALPPSLAQTGPAGMTGPAGAAALAGMLMGMPGMPGMPGLGGLGLPLGLTLPGLPVKAGMPMPGLPGLAMPLGLAAMGLTTMPMQG